MTRISPEMIGRWGYRFPSNEEFASFSQSSLTDVDPAHDDPDDVVIEYYDRSYLLFKLYERAVIQHDYDAAPFVSDGIIDVDSFTSFYTSVRNRRMSRAGKVLEIHIAHILDARGIEYEAQARTENGKKPDFLFPSQAAYEDPTFPETQLRMLASKTSIKDRFRQVADEANRIRDKHLFTLTPGDVTHPKLAQLDELHIHLVMPKVVKESYDDLIQGGDHDVLPVHRGGPGTSGGPSSKPDPSLTARRESSLISPTVRRRRRRRS